MKRFVFTLIVGDRSKPIHKCDEEPIENQFKTAEDFEQSLLSKIKVSKTTKLQINASELLINIALYAHGKMRAFLAP